MKKIFLLGVIFLLKINVFAQTDDVYYSQSQDTTKVNTETLVKKSPGDWLIISANRQLTGYFCYGLSAGVGLLNSYMVMNLDPSFNTIYLGISSIALGIIGTGFIISSAFAKRNAGRALNELGMDLKTTSDGLTLSFKL